MINTPLIQYNDIYENNKNNVGVIDSSNENKEVDPESMKSELQAYLTELKENNTLEPKTDSDIFNNFSNNYESI